MSRLTAFGIILGFTLITLSIVHGGSIWLFFNPDAIFITFGGTIAATFIAYPFSSIRRIAHVALNAFKKVRYLPESYITIILELAKVYRAGGLKKLETEEESLNNRFLRLGVEMVVDGFSSADIDDIFEKEMIYLALRHESGETILRTMAKFAPAFGMVGTLIGLIQVISRLADPNTVGPPLAMALISTFYGILLANLILLPISAKLRTRTEQELLLIRLIKEGIMGLQRQDHPSLMLRHLNAILPPDLRAIKYSPAVRINE